MKIGDQVKVISFNLLKIAPKGTFDSENYWKLIGFVGTIVKDPKEKDLYASFSKEKRLLVQFEKNLRSLNLVCHNAVPNSLWILEKDLMILEK